MSMKKSNDTIWNRTRELPTCSAVPQPTALPRAPIDLLFVVESVTNVTTLKYVSKWPLLVITIKTTWDM